MANGPPGQISLSPLESEKYLASPLVTILESISDPQSEIITLHDLTEAYATLSRRIRLQASSSSILSNNSTCPAFFPLYTHSSSLFLCLIRDISRCLLNPLYILSQQDSSTDEGPILEEGTERAQAYATLSHHALIFLSDIFSLPPLMKTLSIAQQSDLLREVLLILSTPHLPTPNARKTWSLAAWVISSQRLHPDALHPHKETLKKVFARLLSCEYDGISFKAEGMKSVSVLLDRQPGEFLDCLLQLYPHILMCSVTDDFSVQLQFLATLRSIVALKLDSPNSKWTQKIAKQTHDFIKSQSDTLPVLLLSAMEEAESNWDYRAPLWSMLFVACLICICDGGSFTHGYSLKLFLSVLARARNHKRTYVRALHPYVWNCLVWCYSCLPTATNPQTGQDSTGIRKRAFLVLRQELKGGIATALVASLLSSSPTTSETTLVWGILRDLLSSSKESQIREGVQLFCRLFNVQVQPSSLDPRNNIRDLSGIVIRDLFVGSFLNLPENRMRVLLRHLPGPDDRFVRPFTEEQIRGNWKNIVELWVHAVRSTYVPSARFQQYEDQLMTTWQSLLLVQSQTGLGSNIRSMTPSTIDQVTSVVVGFIEGSGDISEQLCQLRLTHLLWSAVNKTSGTTSLSTMAETVLSAVLSQKYTLEGEVRAIWSRLCGDLISTGMPNVVCRLLVRNDIEGRVEVQRKLWCMMAESKSLNVNEARWSDMISFLAVPIGSWTLDFLEVDIWKKLFVDTVKLENRTSRNSCNALLHQLRGGVHCLKSYPILIPSLLEHLHLDIDDPSHVDFLRVTNEFLVKSYPPNPEDHMIALPILDGLARLILACENADIIRFLSVLDEGLCLWIKDQKKSLLEQEHSTLVHDIYCTSLSLLSELPPSLEMLQTLSTFLCSSFERMGHPPIGPLGFEKFWRSAYHGKLESLKGPIPDNVKTCLKAWSDHCGDSLAEGVSSCLDSQSTTRLFVPDSQPPKPCLEPENYEISDSMSTEDIYDLIAPGSELDLPALSLDAPVLGTPQAVTLESHPPQFQPQALTEVTGRKVRVDTELVGMVTRKRLNSQHLSQIHKRRRVDHETNDMRSVLLQTGSSQVAFPSSPSQGYVPKFSSPAARGVPCSLGHSTKAPAINSGSEEEDIVKDHLERSVSLVNKADRVQKLEKIKSSSTKRLQSEPVIELSPPSRPTILRRNHTTSERLGALERAYSLVADSQISSSEVPMEELAHAAQLAHKIGVKIAEQMSKKFPQPL